MGDTRDPETLGMLPARAAQRWGPREALGFQDRRWTFAEIDARVDAVAKGLMALGIAPGDKVALWMVNRPEWIDAMFAVMKIGAVLVPVNTRFRTDDTAYVLGQSDAAAVILAARSGPIDYLAMMREIAPALGARPDPRVPHLRRAIALGAAGPDALRWDEMLEGGREVSDAALRARAAAVDPGDDAFIFYTSGTTGFPKGAVHAHYMIRNAWDHGDRMGVSVNDVILMYLPLFHAFGFVEGALMSMVRGARQVLTETFDPGQCLDLIAGERATVIHGFDTHYKELLDAQEQRPRDVSSVRTGICGTGMSSSIPIARRARKTFGNLMTGFGMSEVGIGVTFSFLDSTEEQCVEANGYPGSGYEVRIVDPDSGADQPVSVPGEILVRGYPVTRGYYNKPEETARAIDRDGWFHTGDMGLFRPDGHMRFLGRYKDMLKIGGENVDPMEVEAFLAGHPAIEVAAVVGLPDARLSEVAVAFVQLAAGRALAERDVIEHCRGRVASFKIPRHVAFVSEFPMTSTGKIQKVKLRERARAEWPEGPAR